MLNLNVLQALMEPQRAERASLVEGVGCAKRWPKLNVSLFFLCYKESEVDTGEQAGRCLDYCKVFDFQASTGMIQSYLVDPQRPLGQARSSISGRGDRRAS